MSDEIQSPEEGQNEELRADDQQIVSEPEVEAPQDDSVSYDSYQKLLRQRKADKAKALEMQAQLESLLEEKKARETEELKQQNKYEELYKATLQENEAMKAERKAQEKALVDEHKRRELDKELGGLSKSDYFRFANLDNILIADDGTVDLNSVKIEANRFRKEYPELIRPSRNVNINSQAPSNDGKILNKPSVDAKSMSAEQRSAYKEKFLRDQFKKNK